MLRGQTMTPYSPPQSNAQNKESTPCHSQILPSLFLPYTYPPKPKYAPIKSNDLSTTNNHKLEP